MGHTACPLGARPKLEDDQLYELCAPSTAPSDPSVPTTLSAYLGKKHFCLTQHCITLTQLHAQTMA